MVPDPSKPRHPIRVVAHRTGLTPATIRAWERRYRAVEPARSGGGQRLYSDTDIDRLSTLRALTDMGRSISSVAALPHGAAETLLSEDLEAATPGEGALPTGSGSAWVDEALRHVKDMDTGALEHTLWSALLSLGARSFLGQVAAPLLSRVGAEWAAGRVSPAQEHLGSRVLERVLTRIDEPTRSSSGPVVVIGTLPGEAHALGARLAAAAAAVEGWQTFYLGASLPVEEIAQAAKNVGADAVAISAVKTDNVAKTVRDLGELHQLLGPGVSLIVGGGGARLLSRDRIPSGVRIFDSLDVFSLSGRGEPGA
jgi:methanogenic corrinoid protein MtbC1